MNPFCIKKTITILDVSYNEIDVHFSTIILTNQFILIHNNLSIKTFLNKHFLTYSIPSDICYKVLILIVFTLHTYMTCHLSSNIKNILCSEISKLYACQWLSI